MTEAAAARLGAGIGFGRRTPVLMQSEASECGLICLLMVAAHHGADRDLPAARQRYSVSARGSNLRDLIALAGRMNLAARAVRLEPEALRDLRRPAVLHWNHNHFVTLVAVRRRGIVVHDPAQGRRLADWAEVGESFTGVALELSPTEGFRPVKERASLRLRDLLRRTRGLGGAIAGLVAISLLLEAIVLALPIGLQVVIDQVLVSGDRSLLVLVTLALALAIAVQAGLALVRQWATTGLGASLSMQWKTALHAHLLRLRLSFFARRHLGDITSRFGSIDAIQGMITSSAVVSLLDGFFSIILIVAMAFYGGTLVLVSLGGIALYLGLRIASYRLLRRLMRERIVTEALEQTHFMETARAMASVKALGIEDRRAGTWTNRLVDSLNARIAGEKATAVLGAIRTLVYGMTRLLLIYLGALAVLAGDMTVGMLVAFLAYSEQLAARLGVLVDVVIDFRLLGVHAERISDIALAPPEAGDAAAGPVAPALARAAGAGRLVLRDLRFAYDEGAKPVLDGVNFVVEAGECVAIRGPSGAGKSTLVRLMAGLELPDAGVVEIDGTALRPDTLADYRRRVGAVLQDDQLLAGSIAENVGGFDAPIDGDRVREAARMASVDEDVRAMPMGYETLVGDMGSTLSGGQKQRIILARAFYRRPSVLILDEATSHLDSANEARINERIAGLAMTRIVVAHRESTLRSADRIVALEDLGTPAVPASRPIRAAG